MAPPRLTNRSAPGVPPGTTCRHVTWPECSTKTSVMGYFAGHNMFNVQCSARPSSTRSWIPQRWGTCGHVLQSHKFNQDIARGTPPRSRTCACSTPSLQPGMQLDTSKVTDMRMFRAACSTRIGTGTSDTESMLKASSQDITGWTTRRTTWDVHRRHRVARPSPARRRNRNLRGPISEWVHKPCLVNERVLSGWCVPCGGGGIRPAGDDPSSGDTMCAFPDTAALKAAVARVPLGGAER